MVRTAIKTNPAVSYRKAPNGAGVSYFDCSCQLGYGSRPDPDALDSVTELLQILDYYRIDQALVFHSLSRDTSPRLGNRLLIEQLKGHLRLFPVWSLLPEYFDDTAGAASCLEEMGAQRVKAVRLFPAAHNYSLQAWLSGRMLEALESKRVPVFVPREEVRWSDLHSLLEDHPRLPVVLVNPGYRNDRHLFPLLERHPHFYLESSTYVGHEMIEYFVSRFGAERMLFGTQMPVWDPGAALTTLAYADISAGDRRKICRDNLLRLLGKQDHD